MFGSGEKKEYLCGNKMLEDGNGEKTAAIRHTVI